MEPEKEGQTKVLDLEEKLKRQERLKRLQKQIDQGKYEVSVDSIADSILGKEDGLEDIKKIDKKLLLDLELCESEKNSKK